MAVLEGKTEEITGDYRLRALSAPEDALLVDAVLADAFGFEGLAAEPPGHATFEPARNYVVEFEGEPVANVGAFTRDVIVPGGAVPAAHLALGGVRQTHRRRGLMTRLMTRHLRDARDLHHEPMAVWWASEARIYQRYGCGMAAANQSFAINSREVRLRRPVDPSAGRLREAPPESVQEQLRRVFERVRPGRPGWSSRDDNVWHRAVSDPPPEFRQGYSAKRAVIFEGPGGPEGYAIWRRKQEWSGEIANGEVNVAEVVAATPQAYAAIWEFLLSIDLTRTVRWDFAGLQEPLAFLVDEPRALGARLSDGLWVRILDLPAALQARRYAADLDLVIDVTDPLVPENAGRWRMTVRDGSARCTRTGDEPDLSVAIDDLGAVYLGGTSLGTLGAAGRVSEHRPEALATASAAFGWPVGPSMPEMF